MTEYLTEYIVIGILLGAPLAMGLLFQIRASQLFFAILASELLARYFGHEAELVASSVSNSDRLAAFGEAIVFVLPIILTAIFLRGSVRGGRAILNIIPLAVTGIVFAAFMLPILPADLQAQARDTWLGAQILDLNVLIVGGIVMLHFISLWFIEGKEHHSKKHKKK